jgi:cell division protein FtsX
VGDPVAEPPRSRLRVGATIVANTFRILFLDSVGSWLRDIRHFGPAMASMCLVLIAGGVIGLLSFSGYQLLQAQSRDVSVLTVYLVGSDPSSAGGLISRLHADPRVSRVTYVSKDQALAAAQRRPELAQLANFADSNPFPASLVVNVKRLQDVGAVDAEVRSDPSVDPQIPTSYDAGTYSRVELVLKVLLFGGAALLGAGLIVAIGLTSTGIRGVVGARRDELRVMKLVGAPGWMVRGPFVVEGGISGVVAGMVAGIAVGGLCLVTIEQGRATYLQWLPGINDETALLSIGLLATAGLALGSMTSLFELRKVR